MKIFQFIVTTACFAALAPPVHAEWPSIEWTSAPTTVDSGSQYLIEARGTDPNGELAYVWVDRNGSPYAYEGGGDGWSNTSGNPSTDYGRQDITYTAIAYDIYGNPSNQISRTVHVNDRPTITLTQNPGTVNVGTTFNVEVRGDDGDNNLAQVNIWRDGQPFAFAGGGNGSYGYSSNPTYADTPRTYTFTANAVDNRGMASNTISWSVTVVNPNRHPAIDWLSIPASAYVNETFTVTARATDQDGNLRNVDVYRDASPFAFVGGGNGYVSDAGNPHTVRDQFESADPRVAWYPGYITFQATAFDTQNYQSAIINRNLPIYNRAPAQPTFSGYQGTMQINQTLTFSGTASDPDGNLHAHYVWIKGPNDADYRQIQIMVDWVGRLNNVFNWTFAPGNEHGDWKIKMMGTDGHFHPEIEVTVVVELPPDLPPPAPPTNLQANGVGHAFVNLAWTISTSTFPAVSEQHIYWQPIGGGTVGDILVGGQLAGASVTGLANGTTYRFYLKAKNVQGKWSESSNEVQATTTIPDTTAPDAPTALRFTAAHPTSVSFAWTRATASDVVAQRFYWIVDGAGGSPSENLLASTASTHAVTGLAPGVTYRFYLKAADAAENLSPTSNTLVLRTPLTDDDWDLDGVPNELEIAAGLDPYNPNDAGPGNYIIYTFDSLARLKRDRDGRFVMDEEGNVKGRQP